MDLRSLLLETHAHMPPRRILEDLSEEDAMSRPSNLPHSISGIVSHMDFWQSWFLKRCRSEGEPMAASASLGWPTVATGTWDGLRDRFLNNLEEAAGFGSRADL